MGTLTIVLYAVGGVSLAVALVFFILSRRQ